MPKRLPKPYRHEPNNGRFPGELPIVVISDFTGLIISTNSMERAEATVNKNNRKYKFGVPITSPPLSPGAPQRGIRALVREIEMDARKCIHYGDKPYRKNHWDYRARNFIEIPNGPHMANDPLHTFLNKNP